MIDHETALLMQHHMNELDRLMTQHDTEAHGGDVCLDERVNLVASLAEQLGLDRSHLQYIGRRLAFYRRRREQA